MAVAQAPTGEFRLQPTFVVLGALFASATCGVLVASGTRAAYIPFLAGGLFVIWLLSGTRQALVLVAVPAVLVARPDKFGPMIPGLALAGAAVSLLGMYCVRQRWLPRIPGSTLCLAAYLVLWSVGVSLAHGVPVQPGLALAITCGVGLMVGQMLRERPRLSIGFAIVGVPLALVAIAEVAVGVHLWPAILAGETSSRELSQSLGWRAVSSFGHPLVAGAAFALLALLVASGDRRRERDISVAILILGAVATVSRSALVALIVALGMAIAVRRDGRTKFVLGAIVVTAAAVAALSSVSVLRDSYEQRVFNSTEEQVVRTAALDRVREDFSEDAFRHALGGGIGSANESLDRTGGIAGLRTFDNQYVAQYYDVGWVGLALGLSAIVGLFLTSGRDNVVRAAPVLGAAAVLAAFTDTLTWPALSLLTWVAVGLAVSRPRHPNGRSPGRTGS